METPLNEIYTKLCTALANDPGIKPLIRRFVNLQLPTFTKFLTDVSPADLPELAILPNVFQILPNSGNSQTTILSQSFTIVTTFDTLNIGTPLKLVYYLTRAFTLAQDDFFATNGLYSVELTGGLLDPFGKPEWTRDTQRYCMTMTVNFTFKFNRNDLTNFGD